MTSTEAAPQLTAKKASTTTEAGPKQSNAVQARSRSTESFHGHVHKLKMKRSHGSDGQDVQALESLSLCRSPRRKKRPRREHSDVEQQPELKAARNSKLLKTGRAHTKAIGDKQSRTSIPPAVQDASPKTAPLSHYINLASRAYFFRPREHGYFFHHVPTLIRGRQNRVLLFKGWFNPPHLHHLELLCHVFLKSGPNTIAAMLDPVGNVISDNGKPHAEVCQLNKAERAELLQHDMLDGWCWPHMGKYREVGAYMNRIVSLAEKDGFDLSFVSLTGSDHTNGYAELGNIDAVRWETQDIVTSGATRAFSLWDGEKLERMPGCEDWREILPLKGAGTASRWKCSSSCRICEKAREIWPKDNLEELSGFAADVLERCHKGSGVSYTCRRKTGWTLTFIPSFTDSHRAEISSTKAREILGSVPLEYLYKNLVEMVMNPALLLQIIVFAEHVPDNALVERRRFKVPLPLDASEEDKYFEIHGRRWDMIVNIG